MRIFETSALPSIVFRALLSREFYPAYKGSGLIVFTTSSDGFKVKSFAYLPGYDASREQLVLAEKSYPNSMIATISDGIMNVHKGTQAASMLSVLQKSTPPEPPKTFGVGECAALLGCSRKNVQKRIATGNLKATKTPIGSLVELTDLLAYAAKPMIKTSTRHKLMKNLETAGHRF